MAGGIVNTASGVQTIDALLGNTHWSSHNLTYNFPTAATDPPYNTTTYFTDGSTPSTPTFSFTTFEAASASLQSAVTLIMVGLGRLANLNYTKAAANVNADTSVALASLFPDAELGTAPGGNGYYPGVVQRGGDVWFNGDQTRFDANVIQGTSAYYVVLHELGHSVGLKHGHANDRRGPTTDLLPAYLDSMENSVMTYRRYVDAPVIPVANDTQADSYAQSLMQLDIAAIQYMYGAEYGISAFNTSTRYSFSQTTGEMFINGVSWGDPTGNRIFRTIWDGGGANDYYDLSSYTSNVIINLNPGASSNFNSGQLAQLGGASTVTTADDHYASGNVYNALLYQGNTASLIESAVGGSGNDTFIGNSVSNGFTGGLGSDTVYYASDVSNGGFGAVQVYLSSNIGRDGWGIYDSYVSIENVIGTNVNNPGYNDIIFGDGNANYVDALGGGDIVVAGAGADTVYGGLGTDALYGGNDGDVLVGSSFSAAFSGEIDYLLGEAGNDYLFTGTAGNSYTDGGIGNDTIYGGSAGDYIISGAGSDTVTLGGGVDLAIIYAAELGAGQVDYFLDFTDGQDYVYTSASRAASTTFGNGAGYAYMITSVSGGIHTTVFYGVTAAQIQDQVFFNL
jgi:serralysin